MIGCETIRVSSARGDYDVLVGQGLLSACGDLIVERTSLRRCAVVADETVAGLFGAQVVASLEGSGFDVASHVIPAGEASKNWSLAGEILERLVSAGLGRDGLVVALGGGVVGDLAGFVASTLARGVPVVQLPTTLLAQVDSSIGGKTGVDLESGKNLAGTFWSPLAVVTDTGCLTSLDDAQWASGLAEVAKSAILDGEASTGRLESDTGALTSRDGDATMRAVLMAASLKARVVSEDERESGLRECLNYGHTLGHAIELVAGYGKVPHGLAVAEGMRFAAIVGERVLGASSAWTFRQDALLNGLGLPVVPRPWDAAGLLEAMYADKKVRSGEVRMVLTRAPGAWEVRELNRAVLADALNVWAKLGS